VERDKEIREHVAKLLDWKDAHVDFDAVVKVSPKLRGVVPEKAPHSLWQLLEHLRLAQSDILDFCRNPEYSEKSWPEDYWPESPIPPKASAWDASVGEFRRDLEEFRRLAADSSVDLFARIPHGSGQTLLRELLLVADHNAYHVGQMVLIRRLLGIWPAR
jgi:uncharacterized damage-inducible protein DinB